uniref:Uncharacterized protein n=1 Tax=Daphnia magna TaxID=35525 RepID=A0A0P6HQP8_9CRUS
MLLSASTWCSPPSTTDATGAQTKSSIKCETCPCPPAIYLGKKKNPFVISIPYGRVRATWVTRDTMRTDAIRPVRDQTNIKLNWCLLSRFFCFSNHSTVSSRSPCTGGILT